VRNLITKHAQFEFKPKKEELMSQRLIHYKEGDWQNYVKMIGTASTAYNTLIMQRTKQVIEHLEMLEQNWVVSQNEVMRDPNMSRRMMEHDLTIAMSLDAKEVTESKEEIKRIWMEKIRMEGELVIKLSGT
jgi:hypothetical protein